MDEQARKKMAMVKKFVTSNSKQIEDLMEEKEPWNQRLLLGFSAELKYVEPVALKIDSYFLWQVRNFQFNIYAFKSSSFDILYFSS